MYTYKEFTSEKLEEIKDIYRLEGWNAYLKDDEALVRAFDNSLYNLGAFNGDRLIGFIRCLGDGEHFVIIQDLIVRKEYQQKGIGSKLFKDCSEKYGHVRMFHVVTDIEDPVDNHFYQSKGMKKLDEGYMVSYFRP